MRATVVILLVISTIIFSSNIMYADVVKSQKHGGPNGYDDIYETHTGGNHSLDCQNPGYAKCEWDIKPSGYVGINLIDYAEIQIGNGTPNGSYLEVISGTTAVVTWTTNSQTGETTITLVNF